MFGGGLITCGIYALPLLLRGHVFLHSGVASACAWNFKRNSIKLFRWKFHSCQTIQCIGTIQGFWNICMRELTAAPFTLNKQSMRAEKCIHTSGSLPEWKQVGKFSPSSHPLGQNKFHTLHLTFLAPIDSHSISVAIYRCFVLRRVWNALEMILVFTLLHFTRVKIMFITRPLDVRRNSHVIRMNVNVRQKNARIDGRNVWRNAKNKQQICLSIANDQPAKLHPMRYQRSSSYCNRYKCIRCHECSRNTTTTTTTTVTMAKRAEHTNLAAHGNC